MSPDPANLDVVTLASLAGDAGSRFVLARLTDAGHPGVRISHGYVFQRLLLGNPTIGELAESLGITQQGTSRHVADLEELGLAERVPDPLDQRVRRVRLTRAGRATIDSARVARADVERQLATRFGADDVAAAKRVLAGLLEVAGESGLVRRRAMPLPPD